jgi:hypothetical protein
MPIKVRLFKISSLFFVQEEFYARSLQGRLMRASQPAEFQKYKEVAERQGFEPWIPCGIHAFQACAFSHSAISPRWQHSIEGNTSALRSLTFLDQTYCGFAF